MRLSTRATLAALSMAAGLIGASAGGADAQTAKLEAGTLTCRGSGSVGLILGSRQSLTCRFVPAGKGQRQNYSATITRIGLDVGVKGASTMVWTVLYSTSTVPPRALVGNYSGVSADVAVGIGAGANVLVGGSRNSVVLQPLSVQGETGLNLAVGVAGLRLR
jgi:Protein of unknown function (DUF992)